MRAFFVFYTGRLPESRLPRAERSEGSRCLAERSKGQPRARVGCVLPTALYRDMPRGAQRNTCHRRECPVKRRGRGSSESFPAPDGKDPKGGTIYFFTRRLTESSWPFTTKVTVTIVVLPLNGRMAAAAASFEH